MSRTSSFRSTRLADAYPVRFGGCLVASLLVVGLVFHLPLHEKTERVGWRFATDPHPFQFELMDIRPAEAPAATVPVTTFGEQARSAASLAEHEERFDASLSEVPVPVPEPTKLEAQHAVLEFSEQQPTILGGLSAYYLNIRYPQAAIDAGVEGRLILSFVVEPDGSATQIEVLKPLHPLCDSSAVQALRHTRFMPGQQNGHAVRVRMRLPVQFKIIPGPGTETASIP